MDDINKKTSSKIHQSRETYKYLNIFKHDLKESETISGINENDIVNIEKELVDIVEEANPSNLINSIEAVQENQTPTDLDTALYTPTRQGSHKVISNIIKDYPLSQIYNSPQMTSRYQLTSTDVVKLNKHPKAKGFFIYKALHCSTKKSEVLVDNTVQESQIMEILKDFQEDEKKKTFDLETFIIDLDTSLEDYINSQKGSEYLGSVLDLLSAEDVKQLVLNICKNLSSILLNRNGSWFLTKLVNCISTPIRELLLFDVDC